MNESWISTAELCERLCVTKERWKQLCHHDAAGEAIRHRPRDGRSTEWSAEDVDYVRRVRRAAQIGLAPALRVGKRHRENQEMRSREEESESRLRDQLAYEIALGEELGLIEELQGEISRLASVLTKM